MSETEFNVNEIVWFKTGTHSASRVKIVDKKENCYIVHFIDRAPDQSDGSECNNSSYPLAGVPILKRNCVKC